MLAINSKEKFNQIVSESLAKAANFPRWQNAINKAVVQMELQPEFITWMPETKSIVIWSQGSNEVHAANGTCDCKAYERGFPCYHRAMARLVRLYMEAECVQLDSPLAMHKDVIREDERAIYMAPFRKEEPKRNGFRL